VRVERSLPRALKQRPCSRVEGWIRHACSTLQVIGPPGDDTWEDGHHGGCARHDDVRAKTQ
jgi:hypothetical protein